MNNKLNVGYRSVENHSDTERVLFIDDEKALTDVGRQMLERLGYAVTVQTNSIGAVELFKSKPYDFDLVITDFSMPGMTGDLLSAAIVKVRPDIPVILCTGYKKEMSNQKAKEMGICAITQKPFSMSSLAKTIRKVLDESKN